MNSKRSQTKTVHALKSPYPEPSWPTISSQLENDILELLLPLLTPIGQYRRKHVPISMGRNRKKRQRKDASSQQDAGADQTNPSQTLVNITDDPLGLLKYMTIGFNSTVRHLEALSQQADPVHSSRKDGGDALPSLIAVFVCTSVLPDIMTASLPLLAAMASRNLKGEDAIRLIPISQPASLKLSDAVKQPSVNIMGVLADAPGTETLEMLIRSVEGVAVPWMLDSTQHKYQPVKIESQEVSVSQPKSKVAKRKREK